MKNMMEINGYRALIQKELRAEGRCLKCAVGAASGGYPGRSGVPPASSDVSEITEKALGGESHAGNIRC